jgi:hypothetical protein
VAVGWQALESNTLASANTAVGYQALQSFTTGPVGFEQIGLCTAVGFQVLANATGGFANSGFGYQALMNNTDGTRNTAIGSQALFSNDTGSSNTAIGDSALSVNNSDSNTAVGSDALENNTMGGTNTGIGHDALFFNDLGESNTAIGSGALLGNTSGSHNVALGVLAGSNATTGDNNIYIGSDAGGVAGEAHHTYISNINATVVSGSTVTVDGTGLLGHAASSRRYKEDIKPMQNASETLYRLKPVTYRYKKAIDPSQSPAFGLIAEEVADVNPSLVGRNPKGEPESVRYEQINAMLLNEFLKEHRKVQDLERGMAALTAQVKEQAAELQKVTTQLRVSRPTTDLVSK